MSSSSQNSIFRIKCEPNNYPCERTVWRDANEPLYQGAKSGMIRWRPCSAKKAAGT